MEDNHGLLAREYIDINDNVVTYEDMMQSRCHGIIRIEKKDGRCRILPLVDTDISSICFYMCGKK